jgi:hypothetical protein
MDFKFVFYCFVSILVITSGGYFFFSTQQETVAAIFFLGTTVAALFFGFRWFNSSGDTNTTSGPWPPSVNFCPDFLTLANINNEQLCIDTIGVAQAGGIATSDGTNVGEQYLFHLYNSSSGADRISLLCQEAKNKKVTWEGVWDGSTCLANIEPPKPPFTSQSVSTETTTTSGGGGGGYGGGDGGSGSGNGRGGGRGRGRGGGRGGGPRGNRGGGGY